MEIDELAVHRAILLSPSIIEEVLGIKLDTGSLEHHYQISGKGDHIDFVFRDISGLIYLAEVKLQVPPISVIPQLYEHEFKKFSQLNPDLDKKKIIPVIMIDNESVTDSDAEILSGMNIRLGKYDLSKIKAILESKPGEDIPRAFELPETGSIEDFLSKVRKLKEEFGDVNLLLEGFRGTRWWDGYYDFRVFWLWKEGKYPEKHQKIFKLLCEGKKEDTIWFTFINAISDNEDVADYMVFQKGWLWEKVLSARKDATKWNEFEKNLSNSGRWAIMALFDHQKRAQVVKDYLDRVDISQEKYFLARISKTNNPFDGYNEVWKSIYEIKHVGRVVAGLFSIFLSQWRILPIMPSELIRESRFLNRGLKSLEILRPMESPRDALLRMAKKYSVTPIVFERALHKLGRISKINQGTDSPA